jgi:hypothetical protein
VFERIWTYPIHHQVGAFAADGDDCFLAARNTKLVALSAHTGECRWSVQIRNPWGWIAFNERTVFYLNQHACLIAVDRRTGKQLWTRELLGINGWLHASEERVVVGGWRGYTDIVTLDANDGHTCWSRSARDAALHSTRVHAESKTLVIVEPNNKRIAFVRITDGKEVEEYAVDSWESGFIERPTGTTRNSDPAIVRSSQHEFLVITGATPNVRVVPVDVNIWSQDLSCSGSVVPFVTSTHELSAWHLTDNRLLSFGPIQHNQSDNLPLCQVSPESYLVGTSFGELRYFAHSAQVITHQKVGKRIKKIALSGAIVVCGTDSGEIVGLNIKEEG